MSVNGTGLDRKSKKPLNDNTSWTVREPHNPAPVEYQDSKKQWKEAKGMSGADAFALVRLLRRKGQHTVAVRS